MTNIIPLCIHLIIRTFNRPTVVIVASEFKTIMRGKSRQDFIFQQHRRDNMENFFSLALLVSLKKDLLTNNLNAFLTIVNFPNRKRHFIWCYLHSECKSGLFKCFSIPNFQGLWQEKKHGFPFSYVTYQFKSLLIFM